jgi:hypothetical protein
MGVIPDGIQNQLSFWDVHTAVWTGNEAKIGLVAAQTAQLAALFATAQGAFNDQQSAQAAARAATEALHNALDDLNDFGAGLIMTIKTKAEVDADPNVYVEAQIPAPKAPTPAGIPPVPSDVTAFIDTDGNVQIAWKGSTQYSTSFSIHRQLHGETGWTWVGNAAGKRFKDTTVPAGSQSAAYKVFALRSAGQSAGSEPAFVVFGQAQMAA